MGWGTLKGEKVRLVLPSKFSQILSCVWSSLWNWKGPISLLLRTQPRNADLRSMAPVSYVLPILYVAYIWYSPSPLSSFSSLFFVFLSPLFSCKFSLLCPQSRLSSHHHLVSHFFPHPISPLPVAVHCILDICINSLDFSAHNLTVNRKWLTWISILLYEHRARAAFVYTIILLKAFTLTNCLRSKEEKKKEIQLGEMWERGGEKVNLLHWHNSDTSLVDELWKQRTDSGQLPRLRLTGLYCAAINKPLA